MVGGCAASCLVSLLVAWRVTHVRGMPLGAAAQQPHTPARARLLVTKRGHCPDRLCCDYFTGYQEDCFLLRRLRRRHPGGEAQGRPALPLHAARAWGPPPVPLLPMHPAEQPHNAHAAMTTKSPAPDSLSILTPRSRPRCSSADPLPSRYAGLLLPRCYQMAASRSWGTRALRTSVWVDWTACVPHPRRSYLRRMPTWRPSQPSGRPVGSAWRRLWRSWAATRWLTSR